MLLGIKMGLGRILDALAIDFRWRVAAALGGVGLLASDRGDAAAGAWRRRRLWGEGVRRDDRVVRAAVTRLAVAVGPDAVLSLVGLLFVVCVLVVVGDSVG